MPTADPSLYWLALHAPKRGYTDEEYEDAWAADPAVGRFAVADGASESSFAALWSRLLTEGFVAARRPQNLPRLLEGPRRRWSAEVMDLDLPWYAEMKREEGAFATLLGMSVQAPTPDRLGRWRAVAVGDSCLFHVRDGRRVRAFPVRRSSDFGNQPRLIGSREGPAPAAERCSGLMQPGDRFFLMTDALAQWFLYTRESGERPWEAVVSLASAVQPAAAFAAWIEELRAHGGLRNDDVTLLIVEAGPAPEE
jgi:hypothetical protein